MGNLKFKKTYIEPQFLPPAGLAARIGRGYETETETETETEIVCACVCFGSMSNRCAHGSDAIPMPAELLDSRSHLFPATEHFEFWVDIAKNKAKDMYVPFGNLSLCQRT
jgi:hypothetical protein